MDKIRFITPHYDLLFEVENNGIVLYKGQKRKVVADDSPVYHFHFADVETNKSTSWTAHICEFAERVNASGREVVPLDSEEFEKYEKRLKELGL